MPIIQTYAGLTQPFTIGAPVPATVPMGGISAPLQGPTRG
jgi:hypothetical protein